VEPEFTIFLISPANLGGQRARLIFRPEAAFPLAAELRSPAGASLGAVFSFVSGLYFRGKRAYAEAFGRPPPELCGGLVISPCEGLRFLDEAVTLDRLLSWRDVDIDEANPAFTEPLLEHAEALERAYGARTRFVLLGSVATDKYVRPLARVFGDHLLFPPDFVGRGDMSRGALLLRAARDGRELGYRPIEGAERHGPRAASIAVRRRPAPAPAPAPAPVALPATPASGTAPELVVLVGLPGAGKTTFFRERFGGSHVHISKDDLRGGAGPARRQIELLADALAGGRSAVADNTNASPAERAPLYRRGAPARRARRRQLLRLQRARVHRAQRPP
jgi:hypothetical protein